MSIQTVSLVGLGALGILFGHKLAACPACRLRVIADGDRAARYRAEGVTCNGEACAFEYVAPAQPLPPADLVIFAVKSTQLEGAIRDAAGQVGPHTILISLLNGISSEQRLEEVWPGQVVYAVAQGMDATRSGRSLVYSQPGEICFGEKDGSSSPRCQELDRLFEAAGIPHLLCDDILHRQWSKLMLNVGLNQATAAFGVDYGGVQKPGPARTAMLDAMREVQRIASAEGIVLSDAEFDAWVQRTDGLSPTGKPSMRQDAEAGRPTELDLFAGTIRALGKKHGIPTPVNDYFYEAILQLPAERAARGL